jgi:CRP-like cAMP-binding protein
MKKLLNILKESEIFGNFTRSQLELVAEICREKSYSEGEYIVLEGAKSDELYLIAEGKVYIQVNPSLVSKTKPASKSQHTISTLYRGQSFGEMALVDEGLRSASVVAGENGTRVVILEREALLKLCSDYPQLGYRLMFNLAADLALKMRRTGIQIRENMLYGTPNS